MTRRRSCTDLAAATAALAGLAAGLTATAWAAAPKVKAKAPPPSAPAADPARADRTAAVGNVAAIVASSEGADRFTADYVAELVLAGAGGSGRYRTVPPEILTAAVDKTGKEAAACAEDDACVRTLAAALNLHHLLVAKLTGAKKAARLEAWIVTPDSLSVGRAALPAVAGGEDGVIVAAPTLGETLAGTAPLGLLRLDGPGGVTVTVDGKPLGEAPLAHAVLRLAAGEHRVALERKGHEPWAGPVSLEAGKRYVLRWKS